MLQKLGAAIYTTSAPTSKSPAAGATGGDTESATASNPAGWGNPVAVENFDGALSSTWGKYDAPNSDPPRSEDQVTVSGGMMHLTGSVNSKLGKDVGAGVSYNKNLKYGRWEVRWRVDAGAGYGPVILLWPKNNEDWPTYGEIDFMEMGDPTRQQYGTYIHHGSDNNQIGHEWVKGDFTEWHTAAVDWLPDRVTYYMDGKKVWNVTPDMLKTGLPTETVMHLGIQLDQGCDEYMGCRNAQTPDKVVMDIDWVKVYQAP
ncbi:beta-glucanase (GH16 family) [Actinoplanes tereljensis]|nr:glycoside hydrolase family 16 protein [Actinoplanes tereljensis]